MRIASLSIAAAMAVLPLHAAASQHPGPLVDVESEDAPGGVRIEVLGGYDDDGFEHGLLYGARVGYDFNLSRRFLLGVEGELSDVTTDQELTLPPGPGLTVRDGPDVYAGARATFAVSSRFRLHGAAGYTRAPRLLLPRAQRHRRRPGDLPRRLPAERGRAVPHRSPRLHRRRVSLLRL